MHTINVGLRICAVSSPDTVDYIDGQQMLWSDCKNEQADLLIRSSYLGGSHL